MVRRNGRMRCNWRPVVAFSFLRSLQRALPAHQREIRPQHHLSNHFDCVIAWNCVELRGISLEMTGILLCQLDMARVHGSSEIHSRRRGHRCLPHPAVEAGEQRIGSGRQLPAVLLRHRLRQRTARLPPHMRRLSGKGH